MNTHKKPVKLATNGRRRYINIAVALMLRDIQTRFGSTPAFAVAIAWPLSHILLLVLLYSISGRVAPYGDSNVLWFSVGTTPFMIASYVSRFMVYGIVNNRPLLFFPVVTIANILASRVIIEIFVSSALIGSLTLVLVFLSVDFAPNNFDLAFLAFLLSTLLGISLGLLNSALAMLLPQWASVYSLIIVFLWISSGVLFIPSRMPSAIQALLYFHPILQCVELARMAWFEGYTSSIFDARYLMSFILVSAFAGLGLERCFRGRMLYL